MDDYFAGAVVRQPLAPMQTGYPPPGWSAYPQQPAYAAAGRSGGQKLLIGLVVGLGVFLLVGVMAAVAIPAFLHERDVARHTTVAAPETLLGMPHLTDAVSAESERRVLMEAGPGQHVSGAYGVGASWIIVGASRYRMSPADKREWLDAARTQARIQGVTLHDVDPGALGGTLQCGASTKWPMTMCFFVDGGSYGIIGVKGSDDATSTARSAREAFVHRT